ncbi:MAG: hypothetical protein RMJ34_07295 [candidate division WOR-3 bacterium]|nr:hypothetical protein [candidate division WOR-3 bacterium]
MRILRLICKVKETTKPAHLLVFATIFSKSRGWEMKIINDNFEYFGLIGFIITILVINYGFKKK